MATMSASQEKVLDSNLTSYSPSLITNDGPPSAPEQLPTAETPDESQALADFNPGWRFYMVFITLAAVTLAAALDATSLSVALPTIAQELNGTAIEAFWAGTSFLLTSTVFQPTFASMSNIFGRKPMFFLALILFTIGTIVAAVSTNFTLMLIGRSLQGSGGGGIIVISEILVTDLVPLRHRGKWFGFLSSMWAIGSVSGPMIGGAFAMNNNWRWIFWINLPFIAISAVLGFIFVVLQFPPGSFASKLRSFDWVGSFLFIASMTGVLIPLTWGGVSFPWDSWHTLVPLLVGFAGLVAFVVYERYVAAEPMMPSTIFSNWTLRVTYIQTVIHGMILWSLLYYNTLYYEAIKGYSPIITGIALFPETFTVAPASIIVGVVVSITGKYQWAVWSGWAFTILGSGLMMLEATGTTIPQWVFINLVVGLGTGILFPSMAFAVQGSIPVKDIASGVAFYSFFRAFGQTLGIAIGGSIFQNQIRQNILSYPLIASMADEWSQDATALVEIIKIMEDGPVRDQLMSSFADALKIVWAVMCGLAALGGFTSIWTKAYSLDQVLETKHGFIEAERESDPEATKIQNEAEK